ncbi:autotransporter-associated beta strand repeat-containing protein, partial [Enhydrobacter aerosaccus]
LRPGIVTTVLLSLRSRWAARRSMQRIATALVGLMLVCGVGTAALGQTGMPTQSTNIPLSYVPVGSDYRLAINVGINGGPLQSYLFDTGSPGFNAAWNPATWNGFGGGTQAVPTSTIPNGNNVQFCYGTGPGNSCRGYLGNIVQVPSLSFQNPAGGLTTLTTPASGGFQMTAVAADNSVNQNPPWVFPGYFCNSPYSCPSNPNPVAPDGPQFYGIFGAGDFTSPQFGCSVAISLPSRCPSGSETPPVSVGSVLGQISVAGSNIAAQGFIVAANGQPNPGNTGGVSNPPFGTASVMIGGSVTPVTNCNPCVTVGLTPQLIGQFAPVGLPSQNPALPGLVPWARTSSHNFVNPYGATPGNNASLEYGANFGVSLTTPSGTTSTTSITLLDTGTTNLTLSQSLSSVGLAATSISMVGATPAGATIPGLPTTSASLTQGASPYSYAYAPFDANILGLPFFMQNSVMFDLSDRVIGYTPFFVTDAPLATTAGGPLIVSGSNVPLGLAGVISGPGGVVVGNGGAIQTSATNTYTGETSIIAGGMFLVAGPGSIASSSGVVNNGIFDISRAWAPISINTLTGSGTTYLGANTLVLTNASGIFSGVIADSGAYPVGGGNLTIAGGTQGLSGANSYSGATTIQSGAQLNLLGFGSIASSSGLANNGTFDISGVTPTGAGLQALTGSGQVNLGAKTLVLLNANGTFSGVMADGGASGGTGGGLLLVGGSQTLSGANTYTGQTAVAGGFLNLTGSIAGNALVGSAGSLGGTGTIGGNLINAGIVAPGGSYGTLNVSGSYTQAVGGTLYTQVNAAGQASQLAVGGAASLLGGTVLAGVGPGTYGARTTYTIVRATGGVTGAYASAAST